MFKAMIGQDTSNTINGPNLSKMVENADDIYNKWDECENKNQANARW